MWLILFTPPPPQDGQCAYDPSERAANCSRYSFVNEGDEEALKRAVATIGPIAVAIDATRPKFVLYHSGKDVCLFITSDKTFT